MIVGSVTRRNVRQGLAPMLSAASSSRVLKRCSTETTVPITYGVATKRWPKYRPMNVALRKSPVASPAT
jgi:hypothetical protein